MNELEKANLAQALCKSCGLCCDGSIHNWTNLREREIGFARTRGFNLVQVDYDNYAFTQPCPAYRAPLCSIYQNRPDACVNFVCKLLGDLENQEIYLNKAQEVASEARSMIHEIVRSLDWDPQALPLERLIRYHFHEIQDKQDIVGLINQLKDLLHKYWGVKWKVKLE